MRLLAPAEVVNSRSFVPRAPGRRFILKVIDDDIMANHVHALV